jgi:hypothetical protein
MYDILPTDCHLAKEALPYLPFPTTGAEAAAVCSFSCLVDDRNGEERDQQQDSALNGDGGKGNERGSAVAGRRHQNSTMMEVEAMVEAVAVTGGIYLGG